jgi:hypothetical protein
MAQNPIEFFGTSGYPPQRTDDKSKFGCCWLHQPGFMPNSGAREVMQSCRHTVRQRISRTSPRLHLSVELLERRALLAFAPIGEEFRANTYTPFNQLNASVAADAGGAFVVVWESVVQDGSGFGIYAQRYDAGGRRANAEFRVNTTTFRSQESPAVAMDADGDFVVVWENHENDFERDVYARRYNAAGVPQGGEIVVNVIRGGDQGRPAVAMAAGGGFVVAWDSFPQDGDGQGIVARQFSAAGDALGGEILVNTTTAGNQSAPAVGLDGAGDFVVAWKGPGAAGGEVTATFARRFDAAGVARGNNFLVGDSPFGNSEAPALAVNSDGAFLIAWGNYSAAGGVFSGDVRARRFAPDGAPRGGEFTVNETIPGAQTQATAAVDADGDVIVAWTIYAADTGERDVFARRFDANGQPLGGDFRVNTAMEGIQTTPSVACDAAGDCVVAWHSNTPNRSEFDVYAQRYRVPRPPVVTGVYLENSAWGQAFRSQLAAAGTGSAALGFSVNPARQLETIAWANLDRVSIQFSEDVTVRSADLAVRGVTVPVYPVADFFYDPVTHTATWNLGRSFNSDKVLLDLNGDPGGVGAGGMLLDGEWTGNADIRDAFPSGDGVAGGDFRFLMNVLPRDVNADSVVNILDVLAIRRESGKGQAHSPAYDINGDSRLDQLDQVLIRRALMTRLPARSRRAPCSVPSTVTGSSNSF